jgi:hypothetical protein
MKSHSITRDIESRFLRDVPSHVSRRVSALLKTTIAIFASVPAASRSLISAPWNCAGGMEGVETSSSVFCTKSEIYLRIKAYH